MSFVTILAILAALIALPAVVDLLRRPDLRRIAVRNIVRRPTESLLIVVGSALGTAIIVAALMVGDTFDHSISDIARTDLGEIDLTADYETVGELDRAFAAVTAANIANVDGTLALRSVRVAAAGPGSGSDRAVEPSIQLSAVDFAQAAAFGSDPERYSLGGVVEPNATEVVINEDLADDLEAHVGDTIELFASGQGTELRVVDIIEPIGLGGFSHAWVGQEFLVAIDPTGARSAERLAISNTGTVFDSTNNDEQVGAAAVAALNAAGVDPEVDFTKADLLEDAESEGAELTRIFTVVGGFSVLAGVLLLINLFVMLAEERKPNLGVLRAIGWKRSALRRAFRAEGVLYATVAAVIGAILGIGVGWVIVQLTRGILSGQNPDSDFQLLLSVEPSSLLTAGLVGLVIAMAAIWFTSWRISRLNIISAIRDLPEPKTRRSRLLVNGGGAALIILGALALVSGLSASNAFLALLGVPIAAVGAALIAKNYLPPTVVAGVAGAVAVVWGMLFFPVMPAEMTSDIDIVFFLVFGVVLVAGGVAITTVSGPMLQRLLSIGDRPRVEARVAMAYPAARLFRTAASLAMYSLIIFSLAFMAVLSNGIEAQAGDIADATAAGHDILVRSNSSNPIDADSLLGRSGVTAATTVLRAGAKFSADFYPESVADPDWQGMNGVGPDFAAIGAPRLRDRDARFATDAEALAAVAADPSLIMVADWFLSDNDTSDAEIGAVVTAFAPSGPVELEIVGIVENDFAWSGSWVSTEAVRRIAPEATSTRLYVAVDSEADAAGVADAIEADFLTNGADAETFDARVQRFVEADLGFFSLLQGYLLLGLVIGIAGLAVSLFRAVRERRRQIGMMRAMGLSHGGVRRWFLTEATFVSLMGIATGVTLGVVTGYLVATRSDAFDGSELPFAVPWATIGFIIAVPFVASALAAIVPARRASKLLPSEALRLAD